MSLLEELKQNGCNIEEGLARLMNKADLYEKLLIKLPDSIEQQEVLPFFDSGDIEGAIKSTHSIKGVTGNLSVTPLYKAYTNIVDLLRAGKADEARKAYEDILPVQETILEIIKKYS